MTAGVSGLLESFCRAEVTEVSADCKRSLTFAVSLLSLLGFLLPSSLSLLLSSSLSSSESSLPDSEASDPLKCTL